MARRAHTFAINGHTYVMTQLGALTGRRLAVRLAKLVAAATPTIQRLVEAPEGSFDGIEDIGDLLNEEDLEAFWDEFAKVTVVKTSQQTFVLSEIFDDHFAGEYLAMMKFFGEGLKLNFAGFLDQLPEGSPLKKASGVVQRITSPSQSPSTSTGTSGESSPPPESQTD